VIRDVLAVVFGFVVGVLSGTMGVGGGVLMVPLMVLVFGLRQHIAQGTSLVAIIPTSLVGSYTHSRYGNVLVRAAIWMGLAGAVGAAVGAVLALHLPKEILARIFGAFLLFSAYRIWPRRAKQRPEPTPPAP
jgi:uncharacterized membrane protein YfcA